VLYARPGLTALPASLPSGAGHAGRGRAAAWGQGRHATAVKHLERPAPGGAKPTIAYRHLALPTGQTATDFSKLIVGATTQLNQSGGGYALGLDGQQLEPFRY
jgi:hypothetical protein